MNRSLLAVVTVLVLFAGQSRAQNSAGDYDIGWFDHADLRSKTTGLGTLMRLHPEIRSHAFSLGDAAAFKPEGWDMIVLGSFSELSDDWETFLRRDKVRLLNWVKEGGVLVRMCRYNKSNRPSILPDGYVVERSDSSSEEWHASPDLLGLWKGIDDKFKRVGTGPNNPSWYRRPAGAYGDGKGEDLLGAQDAFESWSDQFVKSAGESDRLSGGKAYALHADYGRGQIILLQFVIDKYDGAQPYRSEDWSRTLSQKLSESFFSCVLRYGRERPNPNKKKPVVIVDPVKPKPQPDSGRKGEGRSIDPKPLDPKPVDPKPIDPKPRPTTLRIEGQIYIDSNGNGRFDPGEKPGRGGLLRDRGRIVDVDDQGRFSITRPRDASGFVQVDLYGGLDLPGGWCRFLPAATDDRLVMNLDLVMRPNGGRTLRALAATLPSGLEDAAVMAAVEARLIEVARKEKAERVILFTDRSTEAELRAMRGRLDFLLRASAGFQLYLAMAPESKALTDLAPRDWTFYLGNWFVRAGDDASIEDIGIGVTNVKVTTIDQREISLPGSPCLRSASNESAASADLIAPILLDPAQLGAEPRYLILEDDPDGRRTRQEPEASRPQPTAPRLPLHPWGKGDIGVLLEQAKEAAKD